MNIELLKIGRVNSLFLTGIYACQAFDLLVKDHTVLAIIVGVAAVASSFNALSFHEEIKKQAVSNDNPK